MSQNIINNYREREDDKIMNKVIKDTEQQVYQMFDDAVQEEKRWATYLFSQGSMIGLSEKLLHQFVEHMAEEWKAIRPIRNTNKSQTHQLDNTLVK